MKYKQDDIVKIKNSKVQHGLSNNSIYEPDNYSSDCNCDVCSGEKSVNLEVFQSCRR